MFMATAGFSILTLASGIIVQEKPKVIESTNQETVPKCYLAKKNWNKVWSYLRLPFIYLPLIFIFLVLLAPGVDDPFFYY